MSEKLPQGTRVQLVNTGTPGDHFGYIAGISAEFPAVFADDVGTIFYIIKLDDPKAFRPDYEYECCVMIQHCLKRV